MEGKKLSVTWSAYLRTVTQTGKTRSRALCRRIYRHTFQ